MFRYPKMPGPAGGQIEKCVAFEKLDGTNLHWEWTRVNGWVNFGTRSASYPLTPEGVTEFGVRHPGLEAAPELFAAFSGTLADIQTAQPKFDRVSAFTEFLGPESFAGMHRTADPKRLVLFDVYVHDHGFLDPWRFRELFGSLPLPRVVFEGRFTGKLTEDVRKGKYDVVEGVVCKGGRTPDVWMAKVKTNAYLARLKRAFGSKWEEYWE
jgi:RNA ligase